MYQRFGLVSVTVSATCLLPDLSADAEHEGDHHADHLVGKKKEDRRGRREYEHHRGGDSGFLARRPGDLVGLLAHLLEKLERIELRHFQVFVVQVFVATAPPGTVNSK